MDKARELIAAGCPSPFIVRAGRQTAGRGRIEGRSWQGEEGASLLMTLALRSGSVPSGAFPLRVGLAACRLLEGFGAQGAESARRLFSIKWPNDILGFRPQGSGDRSPPGGAGASRGDSAANPAESPSLWKKLGGILCEGIPAWTLAGIGINLSPSAYAGEMRGTATSLEELGCWPPAAWRGGPIEPSVEPEALPAEPDAGPPISLSVDRMAIELSEAILRELENPGWAEEYQARMWGLGHRVRFSVGHPSSGVTARGEIRGIDDEGNLLLLEDEELRIYRSGEISGLRPL